MFNSINLKLGNARKVEDYVIYPYNGTGNITLQSDKRIAQVDMSGKGIVSNPHGSGAYFHHLVFERNPIQLTADEIQSIKLMILGSGENPSYKGCISTTQDLTGIRL
jgi:hypothetical protein